MTAQMAKRVTEEYYSWFCGTELFGLERGRHLVCSAGRDQYLPAYGCKFTIWILVKDGLCVGAYSPKYQALFEELEKGGEIIPSLNQRFPMKRMELMVFESEKLSSYGEAKALAPADYPLYESFFRQAYPDAEPDGWLKNYFTQKARGCFTGYLSGGRLLSATCRTCHICRKRYSTPVYAPWKGSAGRAMPCAPRRWQRTICWRTASALSGSAARIVPPP